MGLSIKSVLKEQLRVENVPEWVHSRFVSKLFSLERTGDLSKIFFPSDPTKGFALTYAEWVDEDFVEAQGPLVKASSLIRELVDNDEFMHALTGIGANISLLDEGNPQALKLQSCKLVAMPPITSPARVIEMGSKSKSGFKFPNPSTDTISGAVVALSTAVLRLYSANLQSVDLVGDYYATIVPGAVSKAAVSPTNNFYVQWGNSNSTNDVWKDIVAGCPDNMTRRTHVWRWLRMELRLSEYGEAGKALASALGLEANGSIPTEGLDITGKIIDDDSELVIRVPGILRPAETMTEVDMSSSIIRGLKDTEVPFWMEFQERIFATSKLTKKKGTSSVSLTPLSKAAKELLSKVKVISPFVAERMQSWLRSFSDERLQLAAVRVTNAEFDDIFSGSLYEEPDQPNSDDEDGGMEVDF